MVRGLIIRTDGAARGNPGPASIGGVLIDASRSGAEDEAARPLVTISEYLGRATNNVAEYTAVIRALEVARDLGAREVDLLCDSQLVVLQLRGTWRIKDPKLRPLHERARQLLGGFERWTVAHVRRDANGAADALANEAIDRVRAGGPTRVVRRFDSAGSGGTGSGDTASAATGVAPGDAGPDPGQLRVTILGSGTSHGVPRIACACPTCTSSDPRDRRGRSSVLLAYKDRRVLIDPGMDLRAQALRERLDHLDAVLATHEHTDHIGGLDDLRRFNELTGQLVPLYGRPEILAEIRRRFGYAFADGPLRLGIPQVAAIPLVGPFLVGGRRFVPIPVVHGDRIIAGYRTGSFAYLTDVQRIESDARMLLRDLDVLVVSALRYEPHPTHQTVDEAVSLIGELGPRHAYLTHLDHELRHAELAARLPSGVEPAWDGLSFEVAEAL